MAVLTAAVYAGLLIFKPVYGGDLGEGENWIFVFNRNFFNWFFPAPTVANAVFNYHLPYFLSWLKYAVYLLPVLLAFSIGGAARSSAAGLCAAFFTGIAVPLLSGGGSEQLIMTCSCMALAGLGLSGMKKNLFYEIFTGLLLCALLQSKGTAFPLVVLFLLYRLFSRKKEPFSGIRLIPLLFITAASAVWGAANYEVNGRFLLFTENSERAVENICAGLAGSTATTEGNPKGSVLCRSGTQKQNFFFYAFKKIAAHPVKCTVYSARRLVYLYSEAVPAGKPLLAFMTVTGLLSLPVLYRAGGAYVFLWLSSVYLFFAHLIMPVQFNYFIPSFTLFSFLSGSAAGYTLKSKGGPERAGKIILAAASAPFVLLWLFSFALLFLFPFRRNNPSDPILLADRYPSNALFQKLAAENCIEDCDDAGAARYFENYYKNINGPKVFWRHAQAMFLGGTDIGKDVFVDKNWDGNYPSVLYYALNAYRRDRREEGRRALSCSLQLCMVSRFYSRDDNPEINEKLRRKGAGECINEVFDTADQLSDKSVARTLKQSVIGDAPDLTDPEKLFGVYLKAKRKACAQAPYSDGCIMSYAYGVPQACRDFSPSAFGGPRSVGPEDFNKVGDPVCRYMTSRIILGDAGRKTLSDCVADVPDFSDLQKSLDICDSALKPYNGKGGPSLEGYKKQLAAAAMLQRANILRAMGKESEAYDAVLSVLSVGGIRQDFRISAEKLRDELKGKNMVKKSSGTHRKE